MQYMKSHNRQNGATLLAIMFVLVVSASYVLVSKLNAASRQYGQQSSRSNVLNEAKAALIGYALNYPEYHAGVGPGRLPCPDTTNNGSAVGNCTGATTGRFPFRTVGLETEDFRDQHGERLWYRVANNYRSYSVGGPQVNSELAGDFTVDATSDIVAVIFAPGEPLGAQDRDADSLDVANYLEDDNADTDDIFVTRASGDFNDRLVFITRQELMQAVERRVLGEVQQSIEQYQTTYNSFPWLSPFASSDYKGVSDTYQGRIPYHVASDNTGYTTTINISWDLSSASIYQYSGGTSVAESCIRTTNCGADDPFGAIDEIPLSADCAWSSDAANSKNIVDCTTDASGSWSEVSRFSVDTLSRRRYVLRRSPVLNYTADSMVVTDASTSDLGVRTRTLTKANFSLTNSSNSDVLWVIDYQRACVGCSWGFVDYAYAIINSSTVIDSMSLEVPYDLDVDDDELPQWFVDDGWEEQIYVAYASGETLPGDVTAGQDCNSLGTSCLSVTVNGSTTSNIRAVAVSAGSDLTGSRPSTALTDYLESDNSNTDDVFLKDTFSTTYNDQTRIISVAP